VPYRLDLIIYIDHDDVSNDNTFIDTTMVRHKARWMLVRADFEENLTNSTNTRDIELSWEDYLVEVKRKEENFPSRKDIIIAICDGVLANFGVAASAAAAATHGEDWTSVSVT
jgi:hypothetical protein